MTTETGAGQWGTALSMACAYLDLDCKVYMVKCSYEQKPFRREVMRTYGASVTPSPSETTEVGRKILEEHPGTTGSLGCAISEAVEAATKTEGYRYVLGSVPVSYTHLDVYKRQDNEQRHHKMTDFFDSFFNSQKYNDRSEDHKQGEPEDRLTCLTDKFGKISVFGSLCRLTADKDGEIFDDPSADHRVVWQDQDRNKRGKNADEAVFFV